MERVANRQIHLHDALNPLRDIPVRTLYVTPIYPFMRKKVLRYFELFGDVETIHMHAKKNFQYAFVCYESIKSAKRALSHLEHRIAGLKVTVKAADPWHQPDLLIETLDSLLIPPDQYSELNILAALNDDCLREVFRHLNILDLSNVADVCERFKEHATNTFNAKFSSLTLGRDVVKTQITKNQIEMMMRNFGHLICSINVHGSVVESTSTFLRMMNLFCIDKLNDLELNGFTIKGKSTKKLCLLFGHLEKLQLKNCKLNYRLKTLLEKCDNLKLLNLTRCETGKGKFIKHNFPKLEEAHLVQNFQFNQSSMNSFIAMNANLKKLVIVKNGAINVSRTLDAICRNIPTLVHLEMEQGIQLFDFFVRGARDFRRLTELKTLKFDVDEEPIMSLTRELVTSMLPLENLKLMNGEINNEAIDNISMLKHIEILEFDETKSLTDEHLIKLARELPQLKEIHLTHVGTKLSTIGIKKMLSHASQLTLIKLKAVNTIEIDVDDYKAMLKTVQKRQLHAKLQIEIIGEGGKVNVPETILAQNRNTFNINERVHPCTRRNRTINIFLIHALVDDESDDDGLEPDDAAVERLGFVFDRILNFIF